MISEGEQLATGTRTPKPRRSSDSQLESALVSPSPTTIAGSHAVVEIGGMVLRLGRNPHRGLRWSANVSLQLNTRPTRDHLKYRSYIPGLCVPLPAGELYRWFWNASPSDPSVLDLESSASRFANSKSQLHHVNLTRPTSQSLGPRTASPSDL